MVNARRAHQAGARHTKSLAKAWVPMFTSFVSLAMQGSMLLRVSLAVPTAKQASSLQTRHHRALCAPGASGLLQDRLHAPIVSLVSTTPAQMAQMQMCAGPAQVAENLLPEAPCATGATPARGLHHPVACELRVLTVLLDSTRDIPPVTAALGAMLVGIRMVLAGTTAMPVTGVGTLLEVPPLARAAHLDNTRITITSRAARVALRDIRPQDNGL